MKPHDYADDNCVGRKSPDEIKLGLECCGSVDRCRNGCPYGHTWYPKCIIDNSNDARALIQQLETNNHQLLTKVEQLQAELDKLRERDTAKPCEHKATLYNCLTCPSCGNVVSKHEKWGEKEVRILPDFCQFCGQRIAFPKEGDCE